MQFTRRLVAAAVLLAFIGNAFQAQELTEKNYDSIKKQVMPTVQEEEWKRIGWHATLWDGVIAAQKADKPMMLFAMNGHPVGCT